VITLRQVHGRTVHDAATPEVAGAEGDGLVTDRPGVRIGVWAADCVPVLLVAPKLGVAAAVHSGWRGTAAGVVDGALALLESRWNAKPVDLEAALGPAIGGCCYEVGAEVREALEARYGGRARGAFREHGARLHLDLRSLLADHLRGLGLALVETVGPCTSCRIDVLSSYRRERSDGRQLSHVGWIERAARDH
jgi:hypothetical protein